jgi:hypothetical protein
MRTTKTSAARLAQEIGIPKRRALESVLKARLIARVTQLRYRRLMDVADRTLRCHE